MTTNTPEILSLFKEQLNNQVASIVAAQSFETQGYGFAYWYLRNIGGMTDIEAKIRYVMEAAILELTQLR